MDCHGPRELFAPFPLFSHGLERPIERRARIHPTLTPFMDLVSRPPTATTPVYQDVSATGIAGLDDILCGGLTPYRLYLLEGVPGSGKTKQIYYGNATKDTLGKRHFKMFLLKINGVLSVV